MQTDEATCRRRIQKGHSLDTINFDAAVKSFTEPNAIEKPVVISGKHTYKTQARTVLARLGIVAVHAHAAVAADAGHAGRGVSAMNAQA